MQCPACGGNNVSKTIFGTGYKCLDEECEHMWGVQTDLEKNLDSQFNKLFTKKGN